ncbi:MAG: hypothetical protein ATN31_08840 [Candidatus Epulonipiscioides saccharophilum]|nr:MAG: hypothetical protein ATN31_08840 [Epulopiscium sp. AS2M-Bin001]
MNLNLKSLCEKFIQNRDIIKENFAWDNSLIYPACAMIFVDKNSTANTDNLKSCKTILKQNTGIFSNFRANTRIPVISMMSLSHDPVERIQNTLAFYNVLKKYFWNSEYLALGALILSNMIELDQYDFIAMKASNIYKAIKKIHPFLTSSEDAVFCLLLAASDKTEDEILAYTEECYVLLKPHFFSPNAVQALSHALTLQNGSSKDKCNKVMTLFDNLKQNGYKYGTNFELASLGLLATLDVDRKELIENFGAVNGYLKQQKGYSLFGTIASQRYVHTTMILLKYYGSDTDTSSATFMDTAMSIVIAQEIALVTMIIASSVVNSTVHN